MGCMIRRAPGSSETVFRDPTVDRRQRVLAIDGTSETIMVLEDVTRADIQPLYRDAGCTVISAPFPRVTRFDVTRTGELISLRDSERRWRREALQELEVPEDIAPLDDVRVGNSGAIWVRLGASPADTAATWRRVDPSGEVTRSISLPAGTRVEVITEDAYPWSRQSGISSRSRRR